MGAILAYHMAALKTQVTKVKPVDFIKTIEDEAKRKDSYSALEALQRSYR
jgi:hypothetical protein